MNLVRIATWSEVPEGVPTAATTENVEAEWDVWQTSLHNPNFAEYARVCGAHGARVSDASQLDDALAAAFAHAGPSLVEVLTDAELV